MKHTLAAYAVVYTRQSRQICLHPGKNTPLVYFSLDKAKQAALDMTLGFPDVHVEPVTVTIESLPEVKL
jgi:hypothetical protein